MSGIFIPLVPRQDMVVALKVVTPTGTIVTPSNPRAVGPDINELFLGSGQG